jgi:hypothetical protein
LFAEKKIIQKFLFSFVLFFRQQCKTTKSVNIIKKISYTPAGKHWSPNGVTTGESNGCLGLRVVAASPT